MQDTKCPSHILLLPRNFSNFQCVALCASAALIQLHKGQGNNHMKHFTNYHALSHIPLGSGILLCRDVCSGPAKSLVMVKNTGRVVRAVLSSIHSQKCNTNARPIHSLVAKALWNKSIYGALWQQRECALVSSWRGREISSKMKFHQLTLHKIWGEFAIEGQLDTRQCRGAITPKTHKLSHCSPGATDG